MKTTTARLLLVEEESPDRQRLASGLRQAGFTVTTAEDAAEVLRNLETIDPAVIVVDHSLRGYLNGLDLLRYAKRRRPELPVILTAASGDERMDLPRYGAGVHKTGPTPLKLLRTPWTLTIGWNRLTCMPGLKGVNCVRVCSWNLDPRHMKPLDGCTNCGACVEGCPTVFRTLSFRQGRLGAKPDGLTLPTVHPRQ